MRKPFLLLLAGLCNVSHGATCGSAGVVLRDNQGVLARITQSYDCWSKENRDGQCFRASQVSGGERLQGFRSHRVTYRNKEYAFVESWRRGSPAYVTGAFRWDDDDVRKFVKVDFGFMNGADAQTSFVFDSKLKPPFESLASPPPELDGKRFTFVGCL